MPFSLSRPVRRLVPLGAALCGAAALGALPLATAHAQTRVFGVVYDSIAARPLAGAVVQIVPPTNPSQARSGTADSAGRYQIDSIAPGQYIIGFLHSRLDTLLLDPLLRAIQVGPGPTQIEDLAIPSAATITAAACPAPPASPMGTLQTLPTTPGLLMGRVRDADSSRAAGDATVVATWTELVVDRTGGRRMPRATRATSDAEGRFLLCGVPVGTAVVARASAGTRTSGEVTIELPDDGFMLRDLLVAAPAAPGERRTGDARLVGRVQRPDGSPLQGAQVQVYGSTRVDTTDATGRFSLGNLPPGTTTVETRAIGFVPRRVPVDLANGTADTAVVTLAVVPAVLDTVNVRERSRGINGFEERKDRGFGSFITEEDMARRASTDITDFMRTVPGLTVIPNGQYGSGVSIRGCSPAIFLDGMFIPDGASDVTLLAKPTEMAGIEIYKGTETPVEYQRNGCGAVLLWTKRGPGR